MSATSSPVIPVVLCGGAGTRLWPVSRELFPKPFIRLADGQSLLQKTYMRVAALPGVSEILTVTNRELLWKTKDEYAEALPQRVAHRMLLEPFGRNTAPAITIAMQELAKTYGNDAIALVVSADHVITDQEQFKQAVLEAVALARQGKLVTFGITPTRPETGYGYIEADGAAVARFVEKPDGAQASKYVAAGNYLWNAGMFCFSVGTLLAEMAQYAPELSAASQACLPSAVRIQGSGFTQVEIDPRTFLPLPDISVDYALMEKSRNIAVVRCGFGWDDIGSWNAISAIQPSDADNNHLFGETILQDVANCYIHSEQAVVGAIGVDNLVIVNTPDALLVADRSRVQEVKDIVARLKQNGHESCRVHREVHRPWGVYTVVETGEHFKIKRIAVKPGASLSLQTHRHRSEHWTVVSGQARVTNDSREFTLNVNESTFIAAGHLHRLENPGTEPLIIIEVQVGNYLGEDDITRFDDQYGRGVKQNANAV